jgi:hypothetical protein
VTGIGSKRRGIIPTTPAPAAPTEEVKVLPSNKIRVSVQAANLVDTSSLSLDSKGPVALDRDATLTLALPSLVQGEFVEWATTAVTSVPVSTLFSADAVASLHALARQVDADAAAEVRSVITASSLYVGSKSSEGVDMEALGQMEGFPTAACVMQTDAASPNFLGMRVCANMFA